MVKVKSTSYLSYQIGDVELKFIKNSDEVILSIGEYSAPLNEFLAPFYDKNFPFSEKKSDGESLEEIGEEPKLFTGANGGRFTIPHLKIQLEQGSIIYPRQNKRARCKVDGDGYVLLEKDTFLPKHYLSPEVEWVLEGSEYTVSEDSPATNDTDIEEEIQRVLVDLKSADIYSSTYNLLLTTLERLIGIRGKI